MTTKPLGGFATETDSSGRVRLVKVYGHKKNTSQKIRVTKVVKGFQRP